MTFDTIQQRGDWRPIRYCPGRFVLRGAPALLSVVDLIGEAVRVQRFQSSKARDTVFVACLANGGIISYQQSAGTWVHTLCTMEGFKRKLHQLEITLPASTT
jgi:hypothetical protein